MELPIQVVAVVEHGVVRQLTFAAWVVQELLSLSGHKINTKRFNSCQ
jgi:hypothetical protein